MAIRLPDSFSMQEAMSIGTAGYTAALCVDALEKWGTIKPGSGEVFVTGAAGGVGSVAVALLSAQGYNVTAATGRPETHDYLAFLGPALSIEQVFRKKDRRFKRSVGPAALTTSVRTRW